MNILITGCGGMLGYDMYHTFSREHNVTATDIDLNEDWLEFLDVRDYDMCYDYITINKPDYILHLAALTDLEYYEENSTDAWKTNALGTENIALICKKENIKMVYISTAGIFDGKQDVYNDFDDPNPLSIYGKSKYYGEKVVHNFLSDYYIFRAGWMLGGGVLVKNF